MGGGADSIKTPYIGIGGTISKSERTKSRKGKRKKEKWEHILLTEGGRVDLLSKR